MQGLIHRTTSRKYSESCSPEMDEELLTPIRSMIEILEGFENGKGSAVNE